MSIISHRIQQNYELQPCLLDYNVLDLNHYTVLTLVRKGDIYITLMLQCGDWKNKPRKVLGKHGGGPPDWTGEEGVRSRKTS